MKPEGIRVVEIDLNLPRTVYCLYWTPADCAERPDAPREAARRVARELGWRLLAEGTCAERGETRLLFETREGSVDRGLSRLIGPEDTHRLYVVQPGQAARQAAGHVRDEPVEPPETHYGLFMGGRSWAEDMLDALSRNEPAPVAGTRRRASLAEISRRCPDTRQAVAEAYRSNGYSLKDIAEFFDMHFSEVSAIINASIQ